MLARFMIRKVMASSGLRSMEIFFRRQSTEIVIKNHNFLPSPEEKFDSKLQISDFVSDLMNEDSLKVEYSKSMDPIIDPFSEDCDQEFIDELCPPPEPTFNLASLVNRNPTLQKLVDLGVNLFQLEKKREIADYLARLDFERDVKQHLVFLHRFGIPDELLSHIISRNPLIFKENIKNLETRLKFLRSKGFTHQQIIFMFTTNNPYFINYSIQSMDELFEFLRKEYYLKKEDIPNVLSKVPGTFGKPDMTYRMLSFSLKEVACFDEDQIRSIVVKAPKVFYMAPSKMIANYDLLRYEGGYSNQLIAHEPRPMLNGYQKVYTRLCYLKTLKMHEPDPRKPSFVPLKVFCLSQRNFVERMGLTVADFNEFMKSM